MHVFPIQKNPIRQTLQKPWQSPQGFLKVETESANPRE